MNLEKFFELVLNNPNDISIEYSNIDGKETLIVNGEDLTKEEYDGTEYDDTDIKNEIELYKEKIKLLDDCTFIQVLDEASNRFDISAFNTLLDKEHFTEEEAVLIEKQLDIIKNIIRDNVMNKIQNLIEVLDNF